ncbi:hypothetical protein DM02DRAFT_192553 [Periconia macrospinosa]|uniref:Uncharacterized protein n=1 Tax=Periconia macrospinosa TaxID=97972 RepID=A0A2V1D8L3_9PLEO|nr:hypothetical protein DM02DRAFT_192553 [Periconia macrospinosa]
MESFGGIFFKSPSILPLTTRSNFFLQFKSALSTLSGALHDAIYNTTPTVSSRDRHARIARDKAHLMRALEKLRCRSQRCLELLEKVRKRHSMVDVLMDELVNLRISVENWDFRDDWRKRADVQRRWWGWYIIGEKEGEKNGRGERKERI